MPRGIPKKKPVETQSHTIKIPVSLDTALLVAEHARIHGLSLSQAASALVLQGVHG